MKVINAFLSAVPLSFSYLENFIAGFDFNPTGELAATIDRYGVCLIADVSTNSYSFHTKLDSAQGN